MNEEQRQELFDKLSSLDVSYYGFVIAAIIDLLSVKGFAEIDDIIKLANEYRGMQRGKR